ncbi:MAG: outer membrane beta-barrel protein [Chitinophagales bacterium]
MKKITILVCAITMAAFSSQQVKAQAFEEGNMVFSIGYGFPNLVGAIFNAYETFDGYNSSSLGPIFIKGEYAVNDHIGVGLAIGYSSTTVEWNYDDFDAQGDPVVYTSSWKYSSLGILARVNWHFGDSDVFDPYFGVGMGYRTGNYTFDSTDPDALEDQLSTLVPFGFETTVGARYFFTDNIGAYAELGFAKAPFQIGLAIKI